MNNLRAMVYCNKRSILLRLCAWIFLMGVSPQLYAADSGGANAVQQSTSRTIKGEVKDGDGYPIPGAAVMIKGTTSGTVTDFDGNFTLKVKDSNASIVVSFMGYEPQTIMVGSKSVFKIELEASSINLGEVVAVGYGTQKKETLTGAISSVETDALVRSPNASVANSLAGQITGLSSIQTSGQPGAEDPNIFIRGTGSLTEGASKPLILVDGVENDFFQMDPNEIESISVLKDASATAVFGVRGANGVILVTTRRGKDGPAQITINSSVGIQSPTALLDMADSYSFAQAVRKMNIRDGLSRENSFSDYDMERFRLKDDPLLYPDVDWREELMNKQSLQTQHNVNISGGTKKVKYFTSLGFLYQEGLFKKLEGLDYDNNFDYTRFNYRSNIDINITKSTLLKLGIGGIVGNTQSPLNMTWQDLNISAPMVSPGVVNGRLNMVDPNRYYGILMDNNVLKKYYGAGYKNNVKNTMNLNLALKQKLDFVTKGLSFEVKGAYNTTYTVEKKAVGKREYYQIYYTSEIDGSTLMPGDEGYNYEHAYKIMEKDAPLKYENKIAGRTRDWYFETSLRYNRKFGNHSIGGLILYNQTKKYYIKKPERFESIPTGYVGLVGRITYDYKSKYVAEINAGYNGSENFAPGKRYGLFPSLSLGYVISEEDFMKNQNLISYLKIRGSIGLVGNDRMDGRRFMYLPNSYALGLGDYHKTFKLYTNGYNYGQNSTLWRKGVAEGAIGNPDLTWETAQKTNIGLDAHFLDNRLKFVGDIFYDDRKDILISRKTVPFMAGFGNKFPSVNMGRVKNHGYELQLGWNDKVGDFKYNVSANVSYAKNEIIFQDEVPSRPGEEYLLKTGYEVGAIFGYEYDRLFTEDDFNITTAADGIKTYVMKDGIPDHRNVKIRPGDAKYVDLNGDGQIDSFDQHYLATSKRPDYTFGLNMGFSYKGIFASMNWTGVTGRTLLLDGPFREIGSEKGNNRNYMKYIIDNSWQEETAGQSEFPRMVNGTSSNNKFTSDVWLRDGSYIKLKNVTLGYRFNKSSVERFGLKGLEVKLTGYNLLSFSKFDIMDPESEPNYNDKYPVVKIFNLGATLRF
ncbi:TonB-dependent receptor [Halosquirtibacter xylanolyticus]|uniref:SusC/RagA family TonB-linked outer membrane protein n=1 Tax=Halosquirtibacter xylanolyticus TaxID=3374599 RepID=UPI0037491E30|nr:TonB-dependent receptor [Prolixibacteraceae bacterium]